MQVTSCCWLIDKGSGFWRPNKLGYEVTKLPALIRRRLTPLGITAMEMFYKCSSPLVEKDIPWVISCRHGDLNRMMNLLSCLEKDEMLSPTDFSMSVHNAIVGMYSIIIKNKKMHTALSGSKASFEAGLVEAFALQKEKRETVGYIYYDMPLLQLYKEYCEQKTPLIFLALLLSEDRKADESIEFNSEILHISYGKSEESLLNHEGNRAISFVNFLENNAKKYEITIPGGKFLLERTSQKK